MLPKVLWTTAFSFRPLGVPCGQVKVSLKGDETQRKTQVILSIPGKVIVSSQPLANLSANFCHKSKAQILSPTEQECPANPWTQYQ